jgi:putative inorganic carbon (hco3(-)) transporter
MHEVNASRRSRLLWWLLCTYIFFLPIQVQVLQSADAEDVSGSLRLAPSDGVLMLAVLLAATKFRIRIRAWSFWQPATCVVFTVASLSAALQQGSLSRYIYLNKDIGLLVLFVGYAMVTTIATDWQELRKVLKVFIWSVTLQNVVGLGAFVVAASTGIDLPWTSYGGQRLSGLLVDANAYGGLLTLTLTLAEVASSGSVPLLGRKGLLFCRISLSLGILFTFSRTAWLSLLPLFAFLVVRRGRALAQLAFSGVVGLLLISTFMGDRLLDLVQTMARRPEHVRGRFELADHAFQHFANNPILGGGLGSFLESEGAIVHNTVLWILADMGLLGLIAVGGLIGWYFAAGLRVLRAAPLSEKRIVVGLCLGHAAMFCLSMGVEGLYQRHWWLIMALLGSAHAIVRKPSPVLQYEHSRQTVADVC